VKARKLITIILIIFIVQFLSSFYRSEIINFINYLISHGLYKISLPAFMFIAGMLIAAFELPKAKWPLGILILILWWALLLPYFYFWGYSHSSFTKLSAVIGMLSVFSISYLRHHLTRPRTPPAARAGRA